MPRRPGTRRAGSAWDRLPPGRIPGQAPSPELGARLDRQVAAAGVDVDLDVRVAATVADHFLVPHDRLRVLEAHVDVAASLVGQRLERGPRGEAQRDVARSGIRGDPGEACAPVLQPDVSRSRVGLELLDIAVDDVDVPRSGVDVDELRVHLPDGDVPGADIAGDLLPLEARDVAVAAARVADQLPLHVGRLHVARAGVG